jgi:hypothetical protein
MPALFVVKKMYFLTTGFTSVDKCVAGVWIVVTTITSKTLSAKNNIPL